MAGGIGPPQDSTRRALVGTSHKIPAKDEAWFYELRFVPWHKRDEPVAVSRVYDERLRRPGLRSRLAPDTCGPKGLDNAAAIIDGSGRKNSDRIKPLPCSSATSSCCVRVERS